MSTSTSSTWTPAFDVYQGRIGDRLALFSVDLMAADRAPMEDRSTHVLVTARNPNGPNRRTPAEEVDAIYSLEDVLLPIASELNAAYVGRHTLNGETAFSFYLVGDPAAFIERAIALSSKSFSLSARTENDPKWGYYFEFLLPDAYEYQSMMNRHLLATMRQCGDPLTSARPVDHGALFQKRSLALSATKQLEQLGYRVSEPVRRGSEDDATTDELPWLITFFRDEPSLSESAADKFCHEILDIVNSFGGEYDGWGSPIKGDHEHEEESWYDEAVGS
ncbi:MAG: DUF695 domain-containing protein [Polyangiaceae bacterium]